MLWYHIDLRILTETLACSSRVSGTSLGGLHWRRNHSAVNPCSISCELLLIIRLFKMLQNVPLNYMGHPNIQRSDVLCSINHFRMIHNLFFKNGRRTIQYPIPSAYSEASYSYFQNYFTILKGWLSQQVFQHACYVTQLVWCVSGPEELHMWSPRWGRVPFWLWGDVSSCSCDATRGWTTEPDAFCCGPKTVTVYFILL